jgi:hypothetical protein
MDMQRFVSVLAFTLGFTGVIALAAGWSSPAVSQTDGRTNDTPGANWITLPSNPSHTSFGTLQPDGTYRGVPSAHDELTWDMDSPARFAPHTPFGTEMPDGTYCGVCVPYLDGTD